MKTIYKYEIELKSKQSIHIGYDYEILSVHEQNGKIFLWCYVDTDLAFDNKVFIEIYDTGEDIYSISNCKFIGTVQLNGFEGHVFEAIK